MTYRPAYAVLPAGAEPRDPEREQADERLARLTLYGPAARTSSHLVEVRRPPREAWETAASPPLTREEFDAWAAAIRRIT